MSQDESEKEPVGPDGKPLSAQPAWRQDFPIDWPEDHYVARRDFTKFLTLTSLAFVVGQIWIGVQNWRRRRKGELPIVPIAIRGTRAALPAGSFMPRPRPISVELAPMLPPPASTAQSDVGATRHAARQAILARINEPDLAPEQ